MLKVTVLQQSDNPSSKQFSDHEIQRLPVQTKRVMSKKRIGPGFAKNLAGIDFRASMSTGAHAAYDGIQK